MDKILTLLKGILGTVKGMIPDVVMNFYHDYKAPILILLVALLVLLSLEGYKIFKGALYVIVPGGLAFAAFKFLAGFVVSKLGDKLPALPYGITYEVIIAVVAAIIGAVLVKFAYKTTIMLLGTAVGFVIGYLGVARLFVRLFPTLAFLQSRPAKAIIGFIIAAIMGIIFILLFKHMFIVLSAIGCMGAAGFLLGMLVMPAAPLLYKLAVAGLGAVIGIYSTIHQYNEEQRSQDIRFYT